MRDETEWTELVDYGANKIVGANRDAILAATNDISNDIDFSHEFYGTGDAADQIVDYLLQYKD
jgi:UDP-GlcNAc3NAcA epimerase